MLRLVVIVLVALAACAAVAGIVVLVGMRRGTPAVLSAVRRFNRAVVNPRVLQTAGAPGAYASVIRHVGRATGRSYETPVSAEPTGDGFVIALPYGTTSNWVRNVMATGVATIVDEGVTYRADRPQIVPLALMIDRFPEKDRRSLARFRVDRCMRLRAERLDPPAEAAAGAPGTAGGQEGPAA